MTAVGRAAGEDGTIDDHPSPLCSDVASLLTGA